MSTIAARLGPPDLQQQIDGSHRLCLDGGDPRAGHAGAVDPRRATPAGVPNTIETLSYPDPPRMERCTLRAFVDGAGNVTSTDWQGSNAGCYDAQQKLAGKG